MQSVVNVFSFYSLSCEIERCPVGYTLYNAKNVGDKCYGFHTVKKNWTEAEAECNKLQQGYLASFQSQAQLDFLFGIVGYVCILRTLCVTVFQNPRV